MNRELRNLTSGTDGNYWNEDLRAQRRQDQRHRTTTRTAQTVEAEALLPTVHDGPRNSQAREEEQEWIGPRPQTEQEENQEIPSTGPKSSKKKKKRTFNTQTGRKHSMGPEPDTNDSYHSSKSTQ